MNKSNQIKNFTLLGKSIKELAANATSSSFLQASNQNPWFTHEFILEALNGIAHMLKQEKLEQWMLNFELPNKPKTIGLVLAGNIPLVGFHDILCVLISGNIAKIKLSTKDQWLYSLIISELFKIDEAYKNNIQFIDGPLKNIDAIIATGSDNTARYFEYYFSKYPNIIRKNRNSIAILDGTETKEELETLAHDIFMYFGLGCRNVSQIFIPKSFDIKRLIEAFSAYEKFNMHNKYFNNYEYQKTIHLLNAIPHFDNGFVLLKENNALASPISVINYSYYSTLDEIETFQQVNKHKIQCAVSKTKLSFPTYCLGMAQKPELWDYADNIDTMQFLTQLNQ